MRCLCILLLWATRLTFSFKCPDAVGQVCRCWTKYSFSSGRREERNYVDCSARELFKIPFMEFTENARVWELRLENNTITSLTSRDFANRIRIHKVDISGNPVGSFIQPGLFSKFASDLKVVIARDIRLNLQNASSLAFLRDLPSLRELDLSRNLEYGIEMLPPVFSENNIYSLRKLSLSLCRIFKINAHVFLRLVHLREVDLSRNYLTKVPRALGSLNLLAKLNLRENDITVIYHGDFSELRCLKELDLSKNLLGQKESFRNGALFGVRNSLTHLFLHNSHLSVIPTNTLSDLRQLKYLDLSSNQISVMNNSSFRGQYRLISLDISDNPWMVDKDMFNGVSGSLLGLRMRKTGLNFIPSAALRRLPFLRELDLSFNSLLAIESLKYITARRLNFHGNRIRYINPDAFSHYLRPLDMDVSNNVLGSLEFIMKSHRCTFYKLNISNNGFICDCNIEELVNSGRTQTLIGDCLQKTGNPVSFRNKTMVSKLQETCGKTEQNYCLWWVPKYNGAENNIFKHASSFLMVAISFCFAHVCHIII